MHSNRAFADEKGARDLAVTVAADQAGEHLGLAAGEAEPLARCLGSGGGKAQPGPARQRLGEAEQGRRGKLAGQGLAGGQGSLGLFAPPAPDRRLRLA